MAEQVRKFTLERVQQGEKIVFKANGKIDFFGEDAFTRVGGAGGPDRNSHALHLHYAFGLPPAAYVAS